MEYSMEELITVVERLTEKYTSKESSSVTYETARRLMNAVLYCLETNSDEGEEITVQEKPEAGIAYQIGYDRVVARVYKARELYDGFIDEFNDYGCRNYSDTIVKGIPSFFIHYDPKFNPQDHILTLDYPTLKPIGSLCGINAIDQYLRNIKTEWEFLSAFDPNCIEALLGRIMVDYKNNYYDNISYEVLLIGLGCIVAEKPVGLLELTKNDLVYIENFFRGDPVEKAEMKIRMLLSQLFLQGFSGNQEMEEYFQSISTDFAVRIVNALNHQCLDNVFYIADAVF